MKHLFGSLVVLVALGRVQAAQEAPVAVEIHDDKVLQTVSEDYDGTNFCALWNPTGAGPGVTKAVGQLGIKLLRYPGGVPCQWFDWEHGVPSHWRDVVLPADLYALSRSSGASLVLQTNTANDSTDSKSTPFTFSSSGEHQSGWVKYAKEKGIKVAFWEIGNEPEMDAPKEFKGDQAKVYGWYNAKYEEQVRAIRRIDPKARVLGPAATNVWFWMNEGNLKKFMAVHGNKSGTGLADAISLHYYPGGGAGDWAAARSIPQKDWTRCWTYITGVLKEYDTRTLPVYITEWNFAGGMKDDSAARMSTALGNADLVGMFRRTGVAGHTHFCLQRIGHGWGFLALKGDLKPESEPSPTYFALLMAGKLGKQVLETKANCDEANVLSAYATRKEDGTIQVMLINKSDKPQPVTLSFSKFSPQGKPMEIHTLQGGSGQIADTEAVYNGVRSPKPATEDLPAPKTETAAAQVSRTVGSYSMEVLVIGRQPSKKSVK